MRYPLFAFILLIFNSTFHHLTAAPTDAQLEKIVALVANEQYAEAKAATEILLTVYPDDVQLTQILDSLSTALEKTSATPETNDIQETGISNQALTGDDLLEFNTVILSIQEAFNITDNAQRSARLRPLLERQVWPAAEVSNNAQWLPYWKARALAAVDLEDQAAGPIAGHHLRRLGVLNATDPATTRLLAQLNQRDWLKPFYGSARIQSVPNGAEISMNGQVLGRTPFTIEKLERGKSYRITLTTKGYLPQSHSWLAQGGESTVINATLTESKVSANGLTGYSINDIEYWVNASETPSKQMGGAPDDHPFRIAQAQLTYAKVGEYERSIEFFDAMRSSGQLNENLHSYFIRAVGDEMIEQKDYDGALAILPKIQNLWHRRNGAVYLTQESGKNGNQPIAQKSLQIAHDAQEAHVTKEGGELLRAGNRAINFSELAFAAHSGGQHFKAVELMQRAENFALAADNQGRDFVWGRIGHIYASMGNYHKAEESLKEVTNGRNLTPMWAYGAWKQAAKAFADSGDRPSALRLLESGRLTLKKASRSFKNLDKESISEELADSCLDDSEVARQIKAKSPEAAFAAYKSSAMNLRYHTENFHAILDLFLEQKKLRDAERMLKDPVLGPYTPPNNQEDIKETEGTLAYGRAKLAAALLIHEGMEAQQNYLKTLAQTPRFNYTTYRETAYLLATEYKKRKG